MPSARRKIALSCAMALASTIGMLMLAKMIATPPKAPPMIRMTWSNLCRLWSDAHERRQTTARQTTVSSPPR